MPNGNSLVIASAFTLERGDNKAITGLKRGLIENLKISTGYSSDGEAYLIGITYSVVKQNYRESYTLNIEAAKQRNYRPMMTLVEALTLIRARVTLHNKAVLESFQEECDKILALENKTET